MGLAENAARNGAGSGDLRKVFGALVVCDLVVYSDGQALRTFFFFPKF